jgi:hypothetical protein
MFRPSRPTQIPALEAYPTHINLFQTPPMFSVSLQELEQWGLDRLQILVALENLTLRSHSLGMMDSIVSKYMPLYRNEQVRHVD